LSARAVDLAVPGNARISVDSRRVAVGHGKLSRCQGKNGALGAGPEIGDPVDADVTGAVQLTSLVTRLNEESRRCGFSVRKGPRDAKRDGEELVAAYPQLAGSRGGDHECRRKDKADLHLVSSDHKVTTNSVKRIGGEKNVARIPGRTIRVSVKSLWCPTEDEQTHPVLSEDSQLSHPTINPRMDACRGKSHGERAMSSATKTIYNVGRLDELTYPTTDPRMNACDRRRENGTAITSSTTALRDESPESRARVRASSSVMPPSVSTEDRGGGTS
jgi:hypothetical protein